MTHIPPGPTGAPPLGQSPGAAAPPPPDRARIAVALLVATGLCVRLAAYFANRSFYIDESALAVSIRDRGWADLLTRPLDYSQTAPPGYLALVKAFVEVFGDGELVFRLPSLLAGCAALVLFARLARQVLSPPGALVAVALFAVGRPLIYFSTEAKPYAFDLLVAVVIAGLALRAWQARFRVRDRAALAIAGVAAVALSQAAVLVLAAAGLGLLALAVRRRDRTRARILLARVAPPWALAVLGAVAYAALSYTQEGRSYMMVFWAEGFMPLPPRSLEDALWLPRSAVVFGMDPLGALLPGVPALLALVGAWRLLRRDPPVFAIVCAQVALALLASTLELYPLGRARIAMDAYAGRVVLYLVPGALLLVGAGIGRLWEETRLARLATGALAVLLVGSAILPTAADFPYLREDARGALAFLARARRPGEPVYAHYRSQHHLRYYAPRLGIPLEGVTLGSCAMNHPRRYLPEWDRVRRLERAWIVALHPQRTDLRLMRAYFRANGRLHLAESRKSALVYLFEGGPAQSAVLPSDDLFRGPADPYQRSIACGALYHR